MEITIEHIDIASWMIEICYNEDLESIKKKTAKISNYDPKSFDLVGDVEDKLLTIKMNMPWVYENQLKNIISEHEFFLENKLFREWFKDENLREAIEWKFDEMKKLDLCEEGIGDLTPLIHSNNLESLRLDNNHITDLSSLSNMTKLKNLAVSDNKIRCLSPLSNLTNLTHLDIGWNKFIDLTPISKLINLIELNISGMTRGMNSIDLENFGLDIRPIIDLKPLSFLICLEKLNISCNIADIKPLFNLEKLTELGIFLSEISHEQKEKFRKFRPNCVLGNWGREKKIKNPPPHTSPIPTTPKPPPNSRTTPFAHPHPHSPFRPHDWTTGLFDEIFGRIAKWRGIFERKLGVIFDRR